MARDVQKQYVEKFILPTITRDSKLEAVLRSKNGLDLSFSSEKNTAKNGVIMRTVESAALEFKADIQRTADLKMIAQALKDEAPVGTEWAEIDPDAMALRSLDQRLSHSGVKNAVTTAYEIGAQIEEESETAAASDAQEVAKDAIDTLEAVQDEPKAVELLQPNIYQQEVTPLPDLVTASELEIGTDEEVTQQEMVDQLSEQAEFTQLTQNGSGATQVTTTIQGNTVTEEVTEAKIVIDPERTAIRAQIAKEIGITIFEARADSPTPFVKGSEIAQYLPEVDQPDAVKSTILPVEVDDGSQKQFVADVHNTGVFTSEQQMENSVDTAASDNPALKVEESTTTIQREATEEEIKNTYDPSPRYKSAVA